MTNPQFKQKFIKYLFKLIPTNIRKEFGDFEMTEYNTGYIRMHGGNVHSVYLICRPSKHSELQGEIFVKYKYKEKDFVYDKIYYRPDGCNEYRYNKNFDIDAIYLTGYSILPSLDSITKKHFFETLKEWEQTDKILKETNEYVSAYQVIKNKEKVRIAYIICSDKITSVSDETQKIVDSITENFTIKDCIYGCKGTLDKDKVIKSDPIYLIVYDKNAENIAKQLKKKV